MKGFEIELCLMIVPLKVYEISDSEIQKKFTENQPLYHI